MAWHVRKNRSLHERVLALTLTVASVPRVGSGHALSVTRIEDGFWRAEARVGFMEKPNVPAILEACKILHAQIDLDDVTYYVGHETIVPREAGKPGLPHWEVAIFAWMGRNAARISDYLELPHDQVVEIGREIAI